MKIPWDEDKIRLFDKFLYEANKNVFMFMTVKQIKRWLEKLGIPYLVTYQRKTKFSPRTRFKIYIGEKELKNKYDINRIPLLPRRHFGVWISSFVLGVMVYLGLVVRPTYLLRLDSGSNNIFTACYKTWRRYTAALGCASSKDKTGTTEV